MRGISFLLAAAVVLLVAAGFYFLGGRDDAGVGDSDPTAHHTAAPAEPGADARADRLIGDQTTAAVKDSDPSRRALESIAASAAATARVRARLMQTGKPLGGAKVTLVGLRGDPQRRADETPAADAQGIVEIAAVRAGDYRLRVDDDRAPFGWMSPEFRLAEGQDRDLGNLDVPPTCGVRGTVRDSSGAPLAQVRVFLRLGLLGSLFDRDTPPELTRLTDAQGRFEILRLAPGSWVVAADHEAFLRAERLVDLADGQHADIGDLRLEKGRELMGVVVDQGGKPVAAARVCYEHTTRAGGNQATSYADQRAVPTDANGRFRLAGLPPEVKLKAEAKGFKPLMGHAVAENAIEVRLVLERRQGISGVVTNLAGRSGVKVWMSTAGTQGAGHDVVLGRRRQADVESNGRFFFEDVPPGVHTLIADAPDYGASKPRRVRVAEAGAHDVELELLAGPRVEVVATDARGQPVAGASVRLRVKSDEPSMALPPGLEADPMFSGPDRQATTDASGRAVLAGAWQGRGTLRVSHDSYLPARKDDLALVGEVVRVAVTLEGGGWIEGTCTDRQGAPLAGIHVRAGEKPKDEPQPAGTRMVRRMTVSAGDFQPSARVQTDPQGKFRIGPLRPGDYVVRANRKESGAGTPLGGPRGGSVWIGGPDDEDADASQAAVVVAAQTSRVALQLATPGGLVGFVRHRGGAVAGARVFLRPKTNTSSPLSDFGGEEATTDGVGRFRFADLRPGDWQITAKPPGGPIPSGPVEAEVREGIETTQDIELGGGVITGTVRRPSGDTRGFEGVEAALARVGGTQEVRQIALAFADSSGGSPRSGGMRMQAPGSPEPVPVGRDGKFRFDFVPAGQWSVRVTGPDEVLLWSKSVDLPKDTGLDLGVVDLDPTWPVEIRVVGADGQPPQFGSLSIERFRDDGKGTERTWGGTIRQGLAKVPGLRAGRYKLTFRAFMMNSGVEPPPNEGELEVAADGRVTGSELRLK